MLDQQTDLAAAPATDAITRDAHTAPSSHPLAFETPANGPPVRGAVRDRRATNVGDVANLASLPLRDRAALRLLVQLRLLTYAQLRTACYGSTHASVTRRRMGQLVRAGAITVWESPNRTGGHTRYALPTPATLQAELHAVARDAALQPFQPLLKLMVPQTTKRALRMEPGMPAPNWLPHQAEVNALVLRMRAETPLRWASSWDCPFPQRVASFELPQPDYVLIEEHADGPRLVFGEHDRGSEPVARFIERKVFLYAALATFPEACAHHFGISAFTVRVTVTDPAHRAPLRRLSDLLEATYRAAGPTAAQVFRFTLAGWLHAAPSDAVWLAPGDAIVRESLRWSEHALRHRHAA
jgi:hypothetical protein